MKTCFALFVALVMSSTLFADDRTVTLPEVVSKGLNALKYSGSASALDAWMVGSPMEKDAAGRSKILGALSSAEGLYGRSTGYEIIQMFSLTPSTLRIYGVILFEKGPLYARWDCFKTADGWVVPEFIVNTAAEKVIPAELMFKL